jgi:hypothetical protein
MMALEPVIDIWTHNTVNILSPISLDVWKYVSGGYVGPSSNGNDGLVKKEISVVVITKKNGRLPDSPSRENLIPVIVSRAIMPKVYTSLFLDGSMK